MERVYPDRIDWKNSPSILTPINDTNLNKVDYALNIIDQRVVDLDANKADEESLDDLIENVTFNPSTGVFTFTWKDGTEYTADVNLSAEPSAHYGTCDTEADVADKEITITASDFVLRPGVIIGVQFANSNSASNVTLNVNGSGAKSIWYNAVYEGSTSTITGSSTYTIFYMYDGTYWRWITHSRLWSDSDTIPSAYSATKASTAAKVASCTGYALTPNSFIHFVTSTGSTAKSSVTLNINSKGAKPLYLNGSVISSSNYSIPAGSYILYYDGTNYYIRTDGKLTVGGLVDIAGNTNKFFRGDGVLAGVGVCNKITVDTDLDDVVETGFYYAGTGVTITNKPSDVNGFGMIVVKSDDTAADKYICQIIFNPRANYEKIYRRFRVNETWNTWAEVIITDEKVKQSIATGNTDRRILLSTGESDSDQTGTVYKNPGLTFNTSSRSLALTRETTTASDSAVYIDLRVTDTDLNTTEQSTISARSPHSASQGGGANLLIHARGALFAGGGESALNTYNALKGSGTGYTSENAFFTADSSVFLLSNCGTIANRCGIGIDTNGAIKPVSSGTYADNAVKIGISTNRFEEGNFVKVNSTKLNNLDVPSDTGTIVVKEYNKDYLKSSNLAKINVNNTYTCITVVDNNDGTLTISNDGTNSASIAIQIATVHVKAGVSYKLVGCPSGGSNSSYRLDLRQASDLTLISDTYDFGSGYTYNPNEDADIAICVRFSAGTVASSLLFKPMVSLDLDATYADFESYIKSNVELDTEKQICKQFYGTCDTAEDVAAKVITVSADQNFKLTTGCVVYVKFANTNSASDVTLNVNGSGAKSITYGGDTILTGSNTTYAGTANYTNQYMYDGTYWKFAGYSYEKDTTYSKMTEAEMRTGTATSARAVTAATLKKITEERIDAKTGKWLEQTATLSTSADTTYTFTDSDITADSMVEVWCEIDGFDYSSLTVASGSVTVVYPKYTSAVSMAVRINVKNITI